MGKGPASKLAAIIRNDGGADATRGKCAPALKAQPRPSMTRNIPAAPKLPNRRGK